MKLENFDKDNLTITFSSKEYAVVLCMARMLDSEYEYLDQIQIGIPKDQISSVAEKLFELSKQAK